jgi:hypothetical protein
VSEQTGKIPAMVAEAKVSALTDYVVDLPAEQRLSALRTGDLGDKTALFNTLDGAQKAEVRKRVRDEIIARQNADDQIRKNNVQEVRAGSVNHVLSYIESPEGSDEEEFAKDMLVEIAVNYPEIIDGQGIVALAKSKQTIQQPGYYEEENPNLVYELKTRIHNGQITSPEALRKEAEERGLGPKQTLSLFSYVEESQQDINNDVDAEARLHTKLVKGQIQVGPTKARAYNSFIANVERRFVDALTAWQEGGEAGPRPNKATVAREYRLYLASSDFQKTIDNTLKILNDKYSDVFTEDTTEDEVRANQNAWGISPDDLQSIIRKIQTIQKNIIARDELR